MHRRLILVQLADYAARHPEEAKTVTRFTDFVHAHADCFERSLAVGHVTGSAWIVDEPGNEVGHEKASAGASAGERESGQGPRVLLTHHRKLDRWLQLGGHSDGDPDTLAVAMREACEESGLHGFEAAVDGIFDLDIHAIPARNREPEHYHYDVRYALRPAGQNNTEYTVSDESHELRWVPLGQVETLTDEESMLRMVRKWKKWVE